VFVEQRLAFRQHLSDLVPESGAPDPQVNVGISNAHLPEEQTVQVVVVILSGVDQDVIRALIEKVDDQAESDDLGPGAEDGHDFHQAAPAI
jgi:hypothetical protein